MDEPCKIDDIIDQVIKLRYAVINCQKTNALLHIIIDKLAEDEETSGGKQKQSGVLRKSKDDEFECNENEKFLRKQNTETKTVFRDFQNYEKMLAERISENVKLQESIAKLQRECRMKDRKIADLSRKLSLEVMAAGKQKSGILKIAEYKEIIGDKNVEIQKLKKELEIEKRRVEKEQAKIKRMVKLDQMKQIQVSKSQSLCRALELESQTNNAIEAKNILARDLERKTAECDTAYRYITKLEIDLAHLKEELKESEQQVSIEKNTIWSLRETMKEMKTQMDGMCHRSEQSASVPDKIKRVKFTEAESKPVMHKPPSEVMDFDVQRELSSISKSTVSLSETGFDTDVDSLYDKAKRVALTKAPDMKIRTGGLFHRSEQSASDKVNRVKLTEADSKPVTLKPPSEVMGSDVRCELFPTSKSTVSVSEMGFDTESKVSLSAKPVLRSSSSCPKFKPVSSKTGRNAKKLVSKMQLRSVEQKLESRLSTLEQLINRNFN